MAGETKYCPECGKANPVGMRFCGHCGAALPLPAVVTSPTETVLSSDAPAAANPEIEPTRKLETAIFADAVAPTLELNRLPVASVFDVPLVDVVVPSDPIARERERDRLLSLASVQRMRAQILDARVSLQKAIIVSQGMPGPQVAPVHEMMGDMLASEERWEQAAAAYEQAQILDPARLSAERKFGEMTLRIADEKAMAKLGGMPDSGGTDAITSGSRAKRNPGFAMILSLIGPGFGQFYNGQFIKGCICLGIFVVAMFFITLTPDIRAIHCFLTPTASCRGLTISPVTWFCILASSLAWLFSLIDAPYFASKTEGQPGESGPAIDKTGWEV